MRDFISAQDRARIDAAIGTDRHRRIPRGKSAFEPGGTASLRDQAEAKFKAALRGKRLRHAEMIERLGRMRAAVAPKNAERNARIVELAASMNALEIADAVGITVDAVRNVLARSGVKALPAPRGPNARARK